MRRKMFYLSVLCFVMTFLWMTGLLMGGNFCLNFMSPVIYGRNCNLSLDGWTDRISDGMIGTVSPLWMTLKERAALSYQNTCELYPTDAVLNALFEENQLDLAEKNAGNDDEGVMADSALRSVSAPVSNGQGIVYTAEMLKDYNYFLNQFYAVDSTTYADGLLDAEMFINMDLTMDLAGPDPKILIYHTHSQEGFSDSRLGEWRDTVVGLGERLKNELEDRYGISVLHMMDTFDVIDGVVDRSAAYTYAEERIRQVLEENPSIKVIIDLHRDGVAEETRLVTNINGKNTAQMMFLNGLCRTSANGPIEYLQNDYLAENLAFSFKLQAKAAEYYPDLMRRIYLRSYQYNLHILPRSILVECGAQTNTVEEVQNAMPLLADLLYLVLSGS